jgi:hypothetical protein
MMFRRIAILASILVACAAGQGTITTATFSRSYSFPPAGLGSTETAQVNLVNSATASTAANAVAPSCAGTVTFTNAAGKSVASAPFTTTGSQIFSTQLSFGALATTGNRAEFVATIEVTTSVPMATPCSLVFSLETFNNSTYATDIFLGNSAATSMTPIPLFGGH